MNKRGHVLNAVLLSIGLGVVLQPTLDIRTLDMIVKLSVPVTLGALMPDVDTAFGKHRKTFHNLPMLATFVAWPIYLGNLQYVWIGILTHYVLDVVGSKRGIALWYPLSSKEWGLPIGVPVSSRMADLVTVLVTILELAVLAAGLYYAAPVLEPYLGEVASLGLR